MFVSLDHEGMGEVCASCGHLLVLGGGGGGSCDSEILFGVAVLQPVGCTWLCVVVFMWPQV